MKQFKLIIALLFVVAISSCSKEEPKPSCETNNTSLLDVVNTFEDPYNIFIDGTYAFQVDAYSAVSNHIIGTGQHYIYLEQASGFIVTPSSYDSDSYFGQCDNVTLKLE